MSAENLPFDSVKIGTLTLAAQDLVPQSAEYSRTGTDIRIDGVSGESVFLRLSAHHDAEFQVYGDRRTSVAGVCNSGKAEVKLYDGLTLFASFQALIQTDHNDSSKRTRIRLQSTGNI